MAGVDEKVAKLEKAMKAMTERAETLEKKSEDASEKMTKAEKDIRELRSSHDETENEVQEVRQAEGRNAGLVHSLKIKVEGDKEEIEDQISKVQANAANAAGVIVNDARTEFGKVRQEMETLHQLVKGLAEGARIELDGFMGELRGARAELDVLKAETVGAFNEVKCKIEEIEKKGTGGEN